MCERRLHLQCFSVVTCSLMHQEKSGTVKEISFQLAWLDIGLLWRKNVNGHANW